VIQTCDFTANLAGAGEGLDAQVRLCLIHQAVAKQTQNAFEIEIVPGMSGSIMLVDKRLRDSSGK
jgi:hypothetical protein